MSIKAFTQAKAFANILLEFKILIISYSDLSCTEHYEAIFKRVFVFKKRLITRTFTTVEAA
jgi:hypothetical protein